jgi:hypothetical protein
VDSSSENGDQFYPELLLGRDFISAAGLSFWTICDAQPFGRFTAQTVLFVL